MMIHGSPPMGGRARRGVAVEGFEQNEDGLIV
jgi:hypothetical protein